MLGASMGPRSFDRGKGPQTDPGHGPGVASMGPRSFDRGKLALSFSRKNRRFLLQWGRDLSIAESGNDRVRAGNDLAASMGPRSFDRGKGRRSRPVRLGLHGASMGPRSFDRGKSLADARRDRPVLASMGPRSFDRGKPLESADLWSPPSLQWGRDLSIAERRARWWGRDSTTTKCIHQLQWGRDLSIAESSRTGATRCREGRGFNGAAIFRSRKGHVDAVVPRQT